MIHAALLTWRTERALNHALELDCWLAAHMADIMHPLGLFSAEANDDE
jgi:nuclear pore complex protein Nup85